MLNERALKDNLQLLFTHDEARRRDPRLDLRALCGGITQFLDIVCLSAAATLTIAFFYFDLTAHGVEALLALRFTTQKLLIGCGCWINWSVSLWAVGLYGPKQHRTVGQLIPPLLFGTTLCTFVMSICLFLRHPGVSIWRPVAFFWVVAAGSLILERSGILLYARAIKPRYRVHRRALIVGSGRRARQLVADLQQNEDFIYEILGFIDSEPQPGADFIEVPTLGTVDDLEQILMRESIDEVFIALPVRSKYDQIVSTIGICECAGVQSQYLADLFPTRVTKRRVAEGTDMERVALHMVHSDSRRYIKYAIDLFGSFFGLIALIPVFLLIALAIKLTSKGPAFFSQARYGLNKHQFQMYKLRTMVENAEAQQADLEHLNETGGPAFKIKDDPRITTVGRFLRRTSLDELPQLLNVLLGQMSLVGPRPLPMRDVNLITEPSLMRRFSVKPGMTGLWQVSGRSNTDFKAWIALDLHYIDHWTPGIDIEILLRTVPVVLRGTGAV